MKVDNSHVKTLYSVEEFLSNSAYVDEGYGKELFSAINALIDLTVYTPSYSVSFYFQDTLHPYNRACTYQPLVREINECIENILISIELSDPKKILRKFSWWDKFNMRDKQSQADYLRGVKDIRFYKPLMERNIDFLKQALGALRSIEIEMSTALPLLKQLTTQGFAYLEKAKKTPDAVSANENEIDRFSRQLTNAVAFKQMALINALQIKQYIEISQLTIDRANEVNIVLIPIWKSLYNNQNSEYSVNIEKVQEVAALHEKVIQSLRNL